MANRHLKSVLQQVQKRIGLEAAGDLSDQLLLERFAQHRDEQAFEALLRRHGATVLNVCQRMLGCSHDAEDAFQATFLVLVSKARSLVKQELVGNWLYGVACRVARKARATAARVRVHEKQVEALPEIVSPESTWADLRPVLDEEVSRLPEKYRVPIILCYFEGKAYGEAARLLHCPAGTVSSRLAKARELLRGRLSRRGLVLSVGTLNTLLAGNAVKAAVPPLLHQATWKMAMLVAAGNTVAAMGVSTQTAALMQATLHGMQVSKLKALAVVMVSVGLICATTGTFLHHTWADKPRDSATREKERDAAAPDAGKPVAFDQRAPAQPAEALPEALWDQLADADPYLSARALLTLVGQRDQAVSFLDRNLRADLLARREVPPGALRTPRVIALLEHIGTSEACRVLERLAGEEREPVAGAARAALAQLGRPRASTPESRWADLTSSDAATVARSILAQAAAPNETVAFLKAKLSPLDVELAALPKPDQIEALEKRAKALQDKVKQAEQDVKQGKRDGMDLLVLHLESVRLADDSNHLFEALLGQQLTILKTQAVTLVQTTSGHDAEPAALRNGSLIAVALLEHIGTAEAKQVLEGLTRTSPPDAALTRRAEAVLQRLAQRPAVPP